MIDQYGRNIEYLRVSVTDLCNFRCVYCMPETGVEQVPHSEILTFEEIVKICSICAKKGISRIKLTGGEPLVRRGISELVREIKQIKGIEQVTLTTNGVLLEQQIVELVQAGIDAINISLDTLDENQYKELTRWGKLEDALRGLHAALKYPEIHIKINCVALPGVNENQWTALAELAKEYPVDVRFIEMMPIGLGKRFPGSNQENVCNILEATFGKPEFLSGKFGNGPAVYAAFPEFCGKIGFISALSHQFCDTCNRVRLTSEGFLKPCLQYNAGADLKSLLRKVASDSELEQAIETVVFGKPCSHQFASKEKDEEQLEERHMSRIGG